MKEEEENIDIEEQSLSTYDEDDYDPNKLYFIKPNYEFAGVFETCVNAAFRTIEDEGGVPTLSGLTFALSLDSSDQFVALKEKSSNHALVVQRALLKIEAVIEQLMLRENKGARFYLEANGWDKKATKSETNREWNEVRTYIKEAN